VKQGGRAQGYDHPCYVGKLQAKMPGQESAPLDSTILIKITLIMLYGTVVKACNCMLLMCPLLGHVTSLPSMQMHLTPPPPSLPVSTKLAMTKKEGKKKEKSKDNDSRGGNLKWTKAGDTALIDMLTRQKVKGNWGDNNLKPKAWVVCVEALARSESESGGAPKGVTVVRG